MSTTEQIRDLALQLPPRDRASLAKDLLESLEIAESPNVNEAAWVEEIEARAEAYDAGQLDADDWQAAIQRARERVRKGRAP